MRLLGLVALLQDFKHKGITMSTIILDRKGLLEPSANCEAQTIFLDTKGVLDVKLFVNGRPVESS